MYEDEPNENKEYHNIFDKLNTELYKHYKHKQNKRFLTLSIISIVAFIVYSLILGLSGVSDAEYSDALARLADVTHTKRQMVDSLNGEILRLNHIIDSIKCITPSKTSLNDSNQKTKSIKKHTIRYVIDVSTPENAIETSENIWYILYRNHKNNYEVKGDVAKVRNAIRRFVALGKIEEYHPEFSNVGYSSDNFNKDFEQTGLFNRNDTKLLKGIEYSVGIIIGGIETNPKVALAEWRALETLLENRGVVDIKKYYTFRTNVDKNGTKTFQILRK